MTDKYTIDDIKTFTYSENGIIALSSGKMNAWVKTENVINLMNQAYEQGKIDYFNATTVQHNELDENYQRLQLEFDSLAKENEKLKEEIKHVYEKGYKSGLESPYKTCINRYIGDLKKENEKDTKDLMRLQGNLIKLTSEHNELQEENEKLKNNISEFRATAEEQVLDLKNRIDELHLENWELKSLLKEKMGCPHHVGDTCKCGWTNVEKVMHAKTLELERENFQLKEAINVFKITVKGIIK